MEFSTRRIFLGLELSAAAREELALVVSQLRIASSSLDARPRWTRQDGWHCTLKFLGDVTPEVVEPFICDISELALPTRIVSAWQGLGAFPSPRRARVVVARLGDEEKRLAEWAHALDQLAARYGIAPEGRSYHPHITVARLRAPAALGPLCEAHFLSGPVELGPVTLYESHRGPRGSSYQPLWSSSSAVH